MPSFCAVVNCNDRYGHSENISFHKFPLKRLHLLKQWEAFIQQERGEDWHASRWSSLCSRHFKEEDFRSLNERRTLKKTAVPSILCDASGVKNGNKCKSTCEKVVEHYENTRDKEFKEILAIKERLEDGVVNGGGIVSNATKSNCRLCGFTSIPVADFLSSYEVYGLLQKCFPTLNIQQEDGLPKVLCEPCHKNLEQFGVFVDRVFAAQTELQRKFRSKAVEKPVKIKQEPLVRVKQEVAESGYEENHDISGLGGVNEDYDGVIEGGVHEECDDQKYEFCDFPIINDCDIMEIINLDDPFINIPDDDNTTTVNDEEESLQKPIQEPVVNNYMPTAHELLQSHLLMEEHNYAYIDAESEFKEERQIYKTEKSENDEKSTDYDISNFRSQQLLQQPIVNNQIHQHNIDNLNNLIDYSAQKPAAGFENRALKPIVTSVSAIQQPTKSSSNGIVVLNESIVKSGCGFQLHACMVCQLKFFSVESLKQHYTQTHGTPMVTVPGGSILLEKVPERPCKMEKEFSENVLENSEKIIEAINNDNNLAKEPQSEIVKVPNNLNETKKETLEIFTGQRHEVSKNCDEDNNKNSTNCSNEKISHNNHRQENKMIVGNKIRKQKPKVPLKYRKPQNVSLNTMVNQYQQLRKLYQKLQKKCSNLEQNVEQLQLMPKMKRTPKLKTKTHLAKKANCNTNRTKISKTISTPSRNIEESSIKKFAFKCAECSKSFSNANSLRQHKITHTDERKHICSLCERSFKRRNGLLQHLKGFHLHVKPFSCPVCKHSYSLKCDMLRCKHSTLRNSYTLFEKSSDK